MSVDVVASVYRNQSTANGGFTLEGAAVCRGHGVAVMDRWIISILSLLCKDSLHLSSFSDTLLGYRMLK